MSKEYKLRSNVGLADFTSFGVGGEAEKFIEVSDSTQLSDVLNIYATEKIWILGYGTNTLISDNGLPGLTIRAVGGNMNFDKDEVVVDAGVWWDDLVKECIKRNLWGVELMSEIPGSVGAATYINITAYGQSIGPLIQWVDVWNRNDNKTERIKKSELEWGYKSSIFQNPIYSNRIILRVSLKLKRSKSDELVYQKAVDVADELSLDKNNLNDRREIIVEARDRAGSLLEKESFTGNRTVGSFFRNPLVTTEQASTVMKYDESGKTKEQIELMNKVHGGDSTRVSAAHVMLAAGFRRGQSWGNVKLNDKNLLKIEATANATAQEIYDVMRIIQQTCKDMLGITLEPEASILGNFTG